MVVFQRGIRFYRQIQNNSRSSSASSTAVNIGLEGNYREREERPMTRDTNDIELEDYNREGEEGTCMSVTNNTEDMTTSRCTEDIVNMMQEMVAEGINSLITRMDGKFDKLDGKLTRKINEIEHKFDRIDGKLTRKINEMEHKIDRKIEKITRKLEYNDGSIRRLNKK